MLESKEITLFLSEEEDKEIILYNIKYSAGTGYGVWFHITNNLHNNKSLASLLEISKENINLLFFD